MRDYKVKTIRALDRGPRSSGVPAPGRAASLHDLHLATDLPKATLTRVVLTLERRGMVWQRLADGAYVASPQAAATCAPAERRELSVEVASPVMERLCRRVNWPSVLALPRLDCMVVIETNRPNPTSRMSLWVQLDFASTCCDLRTGRAYIAFCSEKRAGKRCCSVLRLVASPVTHGAQAGDGGTPAGRDQAAGVWTSHPRFRRALRPDPP